MCYLFVTNMSLAEDHIVLKIIVVILFTFTETFHFNPFLSFHRPNMACVDCKRLLKKCFIQYTKKSNSVCIIVFNKACG
jgi:hypothetical protein